MQPDKMPIATDEQMKTPGNIIKFPDGRAYRVAKGGSLERVILIEGDTPCVGRVVRKSKAEKRADKRRRQAPMKAKKQRVVVG